MGGKGGIAVEYVDMVNQIIAAEHSAKALTEEAKEKQEQFQTDLERELEGLREEYMERARHRVELVEQTERAAAEERIAKLDQKLQDALDAVERSYEKHKDQWVEQLFQMIVEAQP